MRLQQLEGIIAVKENQHFRWAAKKSAITQPGLSGLVQALEEELKLRIFIRNNKQKVVPTKVGAKIIARAKVILAEVEFLKQYAEMLSLPTCKEVRIGIVPSLVSYFQPLLVGEFSKHYNDMTIEVVAMANEQLILGIDDGSLDMAVLANRVRERRFVKYKLISEEFYVYVSKNESIYKDRFIYPGQLRHHKLWMPKDDPFFCRQILRVCRLLKDCTGANLHYESGSMETLINRIDMSEGVTLIPRLMITGLSPEQRENVREFMPPHPIREIDLITSNKYLYLGISETVKKILLKSVSMDKPKTVKQMVPVSSEY
jgi:LysR family transcriptional regulator, hydrogen peroxide-inducible genes activator